MRRTAVIGVIALAAACAVSACGRVQMGAAALVGNGRITTAQLTSQVADAQHAYTATGSKLALGFTQEQWPQVVLAWMLRFRIGDLVAQRYHLTITQTDIDEALASAVTQANAGTGHYTLPVLTAANGLAPDMTQDLGRYQAVLEDLAKRSNGGAAPASQTAQADAEAAVAHAQCVAARQLSIKVNPQFGQMDYLQFKVWPVEPVLTSGPEFVPFRNPPDLTPPC